LASSAKKNDMTANVKKALTKLDWMREQRIWPNGKRYLWTDAFDGLRMIWIQWRS
jgi:hypothetical protein